MKSRRSIVGVFVTLLIKDVDACASFSDDLSVSFYLDTLRRSVLKKQRVLVSTLHIKTKDQLTFESGISAKSTAFFSAPRRHDRDVDCYSWG